jgi:hypothetical protein
MGRSLEVLSTFYERFMPNWSGRLTRGLLFRAWVPLRSLSWVGSFFEGEVRATPKKPQRSRYG